MQSIPVHRCMQPITTNKRAIRDMAIKGTHNGADRASWICANAHRDREGGMYVDPSAWENGIAGHTAMFRRQRLWLDLRRAHLIRGAQRLCRGRWKLHRHG